METRPQTIINVTSSSNSHQHNRELKKSSKTIKLLSFTLLSLIIAFGIVLWYFSSKPILHSGVSDTTQQADINAIAKAVDDYVVKYSAMPISTNVDPNLQHTLDLCDNSCTSGDKVTIHLTRYATSASVISFQPFSQNLSVPNGEIYIVGHATCNKANDGLGYQTYSYYAAVLYRVNNGSVNLQKCIES